MFGLEQWINIQGTNKRYQISNMGRVVSKAQGKARLLTPSFDQKGYPKVVYRLPNGKTHTKHIHRLVAEHFLRRPKGYVVVGHKNGDKTDNRLANLHWVSPKQNYQNLADLRKD